MVPEMALPSGSIDNGASHIQVRHTGVTVAQVVGPIVVSLNVGVALLIDPRGDSNSSAECKERFKRMP
jgi:hypothetical protein